MFFVLFLKVLNLAVRILKITPSPELKLMHLNLAFPQMRCYSNVSFANNENLSLQLGYPIVFADKLNCCHILYY